MNTRHSNVTTISRFEAVSPDGDVSDVLARFKSKQRKIEHRLGNQPRKNEGPWNSLSFYRRNYKPTGAESSDSLQWVGPDAVLAQRRYCETHQSRVYA